MKKSIRARAFAPALSVLSLAVSASVQAQGIEVNPVVVSASRMSQPLSQVLSSVSVITRKDIEKSQAASLAELLQGEAGFEFGRTGGPGTTTSFFMRGQDSTNVVVMVDGVRAQTDGGGNLTTTDYPLAQIERIEILRGNAGALYGESAIGGVINIYTRNGKGAPKVYGSVSYGSYNTTNLIAGYGGEVSGKSFDLNAEITKSDGFSGMNPVQNSSTDPNGNNYSKKNLSFRVEDRLTSQVKIGLRVASNNNETSYDKNNVNAYMLKRTSDSYSFYSKAEITDAWSSGFDVTHSTVNYDDFKNSNPLPSNEGSSILNGSQNAIRWNNIYEVNENNKVGFGVELLKDKYDANGTYGYASNRNTQGYFAGLSSSFDRLTTQINLRQDSVSVERAASGLTKGNDTKASSVLLGAGYRLSDSWLVSSTFSTAFRAPTAYEAFITPTLNPEQHKTKELGLSYQVDGTLARFVIFDTSTTDAIIYKNSRYVNVGQVDNKGIEATVRSSWLGNSIKASLVSQNPWNVSDSTALTRRARQYGSLDVSRPFGAYEVGGRVYVSGARSDMNYSSWPYEPVTLSGYTLWAFYASRKIDNEWTARVKLENAFNREYQLAYGYNTPGRGIYATLQYQPK